MFQEYESELEDIDDEEEVERRRKKKTKKKRPTKTIFDEFEPGKNIRPTKTIFYEFEQVKKLPNIGISKVWKFFFIMVQKQDDCHFVLFSNGSDNWKSKLLASLDHFILTNLINFYI